MALTRWSYPWSLSKMATLRMSSRDAWGRCRAFRGYGAGCGSREFTLSCPSEGRSARGKRTPTPRLPDQGDTAPDWADQVTGSIRLGRPSECCRHEVQDISRLTGAIAVGATAPQVGQAVPEDMQFPPWV